MNEAAGHGGGISLGLVFKAAGSMSRAAAGVAGGVGDKFESIRAGNEITKRTESGKGVHRRAFLGAVTGLASAAFLPRAVKGRPVRIMSPAGGSGVFAAGRPATPAGPWPSRAEHPSARQSLRRTTLDRSIMMTRSARKSWRCFSAALPSDGTESVPRARSLTSATCSRRNSRRTWAPSTAWR